MEVLASLKGEKIGVGLGQGWQEVRVVSSEEEGVGGSEGPEQLWRTGQPENRGPKSGLKKTKSSKCLGPNAR